MTSIQDSFSPASDTSETPFSLSEMVTFSYRYFVTEEKNGSNQPRIVPPFFLYSSTI